MMQYFITGAGCFLPIFGNWDGQASHMYKLPFIDDMYQNKVIVTILESQTTHATQPLDQYPFESFKTNYNDELEEWCGNNDGMPLPKSASFSVFVPAWKCSMTPHNSQASFRVMGIYPINPHGIPADKYVQNTKSRVQRVV